MHNRAKSRAKYCVIYKNINYFNMPLNTLNPYKH